MANGSAIAGSVLVFGLAAAGFIMSTILTADHGDLTRDRASEIVFHMETRLWDNGIYACTATETANIIFDGDKWIRMVDGSGVVATTVTNASTFTIPSDGLYSFDVSLYQASASPSILLSTTVPQFNLRKSGGDTLMQAGWVLEYDSTNSTAGSVHLHATRRLKKDAVLVVELACPDFPITIEQGSVTIRREAIVHGLSLPTATPAPTPAPTPA